MFLFDLTVCTRILDGKQTPTLYVNCCRVVPKLPESQMIIMTNDPWTGVIILV